MLFILVCLFLLLNDSYSALNLSELNVLSGNELYKKALGLSAVGRYEDAATIFWLCINKIGPDSDYEVRFSYIHIMF